MYTGDTLYSYTVPIHYNTGDAYRCRLQRVHYTHYTRYTHSGDAYRCRLQRVHYTLYSLYSTLYTILTILTLVMHTGVDCRELKGAVDLGATEELLRGDRTRGAGENVQVGNAHHPPYTIHHTPCAGGQCTFYSVDAHALHLLTMHSHHTPCTPIIHHTPYSCTIHSHHTPCTPIIHHALPPYRCSECTPPTAAGC
jgi:hypothetical protein